MYVYVCLPENGARNRSEGHQNNHGLKNGAVLVIEKVHHEKKHQVTTVDLQKFTTDSQLVCRCL